MMTDMDLGAATSKPAKHRWRSALRTVLCLCVAWLIYQEVVACIPWYFARKMAREYPRLGKVPHPLNDTRIAELEGMQIERFGCSFQVPWTELADVKDGKTVAAMSFKSGAGLVLVDPATQVDSVGAMRAELTKKGISPERMFGLDAVGSNYDFMMAAVHTTPDQVRLFDFRLKNARGMILLANKLSMVPSGNEGLYDMRQGEMRGIQIGDPSVAPFSVRLELFDMNDRHYELWFNAGKDAKSAAMTQAEINGIVRSLHGSRETHKSSSDFSNGY